MPGALIYPGQQTPGCRGKFGEVVHQEEARGLRASVAGTASSSFSLGLGSCRVHLSFSKGHWSLETRPAGSQQHHTG